MLKNSKYYYKSYDIFNNEFGDERNFGFLNPYGYNFECNTRRFKDNDSSVLRSKENNKNSMINSPKR